jgi:hypothetical protein
VSRLRDKPQPRCPQAAFTVASTIGRGDREKGLGAAFQQKLAARAASKRSNCKGPLGHRRVQSLHKGHDRHIPSNRSTIIDERSLDKPVFPISAKVGLLVQHDAQERDRKSVV